MTARAPRFEICHGDDGWWARFRAANGRVVWVTETYRRRQAAEDAMWLLRDAVVGHFLNRAVVDVRDIDERQP